MNIKLLKPVLRPAPLLITGSVIVVISFLRLMALPQFFPKFDIIPRLEWISYDARMKKLYEHSRPPAPNLAAVFIDDDSIKSFNDNYKFTWPLPRQLYGKVVRELNAQGAKAIAFDILFAEQHQPSDATSVIMPDGSKVASDDFFARQIQAASNKVILAVMGQSLMDEKQPGKIIWEPFVPAPLFTNGAQLAHIVSESDSDGVLRRVLPFRDDGTAEQRGRFWFMGLRLAAQELGLDLDKTVIEKDRMILSGPNKTQRIVPLDQNQSFLITWSMSWNDWRLAKHSIEDLVLMDQRRQSGDTNIAPIFKDKLVVVGSLATGSNVSDRGPTSVDKLTFLVSKHWNVANSIINRQLIKICPLWVEFLLIFAMGLLGAILTWATRPWLAPLCVFGCILIYRALAYHLFIDHLFWLPVVTPVFAALLACHGATMTYRVVVEQQEKRRIKSVFSKVVSPDVVNELLEAEHLALGGAQRRVTIFFADVRGFTELTDSAQARAEEYVRKHNLTGRAAEDYYDEQAGELLGTVNLYLSLVASTVKRHGGTLDKYIGDCVMAFWGAPILNEKHALTCVRTAIATQLAIFKLNAEREMENRRREQENVKRAAAKLPQLPLLSLLMLGSGINTGTVTVGLMGSEEHQLNYTVFGREVNLASRLESVSGRGRVIIGEATYEDLKRDDPALAASCLPQPPVTVKGFRKPVQIYEVPWRPPERAGGPSG